MPVDVVSVTMIKFARTLGMDYNCNIIEIPKVLLEDLSNVPLRSIICQKYNYIWTEFTIIY